MENLAPDEKAILIMVYTQNMLIRGEIVTKELLRVSIWPRSQGVPNLLDIFKPSVLLFGGTPPKSLSLEEMFVPTASLIGFHPALPCDDPLDYDEHELNRTMHPVSILMGTFTVKGHVRISSSSSLATSLEVMYHGWLSIYDAQVTNPFLPQMPALAVKMLLVRPDQTSFFVETKSPAAQ
jgi:hypothetical protein